jgi:hypothetical protein
VLKDIYDFMTVQQSIVFVEMRREADNVAGMMIQVGEYRNKQGNMGINRGITNRKRGINREQGNMGINKGLLVVRREASNYGSINLTLTLIFTLPSP